MKTTATVTHDGVEVETDVCGQVSKQFINMSENIKEKAIRQWLIDNGWTPPNEGERE